MLREGEYPIVRFWYGKGAKYKTIEELIDNEPKLFLWYVEKFQDVTVKQAQHFKDRYGMDLPDEVISDVEPYEHRKGAPSPDTEYEKICEEYFKQKYTKFSKE